MDDSFDNEFDARIREIESRTRERFGPSGESIRAERARERERLEREARQRDRERQEQERAQKAAEHRKRWAPIYEERDRILKLASESGSFETGPVYETGISPESCGNCFDGATRLLNG